MKLKPFLLGLACLFLFAGSVITASLYSKNMENIQYSESTKNKQHYKKLSSSEAQSPGELLIWEIVSRRLLFFNQ